MFLHQLTQDQREAFICLAHDVVVSDGVLRPGEQMLMDHLRNEINLAPDFEPHYIPVEGIADIFDNHAARIAVVINLIRLGYADDAFEIEEQFLLQEICRQFDIGPDQFSVIENWVRRLISLEKEARAFM
ncbi:MAG: TerB family tellurite resistance protein [Pseudomonadales bacterium]